MTGKVTFTKEELDEKVKVPAIVEAELRHLVEDRLEQSGLYHRIFTRIKTSESLERKFRLKTYNQDKKIQDLVGVRVDVYFEDDLRICKDILEQMFDLVEWSESDQKDVEFKPVKINGVFRIPRYLRDQISAETWDMCIDDTVEIQIKTVFFEGWHEIEHDMRYKGGELWIGKNKVARYFNSILATLELCDKSMVTLFENLGHDLYKERNWAGMMKAHYRLKMEEVVIYPEVEEILDTDRSENNIGKQLFKTPRRVLVDALLAKPRRVPINANTIIALVNEAVIHDDRLTRIFHDKDVFDDGSDQMGEEFAYRKLEPLRKVSVFHASVNLSTYKYSRHEACLEAARLAYSWIYDKFGCLDSTIPKQICSFEVHPMGYRVVVDYKPEEDYWSLMTEHIDMETPGQVWVTTAECRLAEDGRQMLTVDNSYAAGSQNRRYINRNFSCPKFYSVISDRIGLFDVRYLSTSRRMIRDRQIPKIRDLINSPRRTMPVCLIVSEEGANGWLDETWLENFRVYDFTRMAGRYTHIYTCSTQAADQVLEGMGVPAGGRAVYVFKPLSSVKSRSAADACVKYTQEDVASSRFGRHKVRSDSSSFDIVFGGQAFYHKLLYEVRADMMK